MSEWRHNMGNTRCILDKHGYMHTNKHGCARTHTGKSIYSLLLFQGNNDWRTRLNITLYVHCLPCWNWHRLVWYKCTDISKKFSISINPPQWKRQLISSESFVTSTRLHGVISQNTVTFVVTAFSRFSYQAVYRTDIWLNSKWLHLKLNFWIILWHF